MQMPAVTLPYPLVLVEWADTHLAEAGWQELESIEHDDDCIVQTCGFLIPDTDPGSKKNHVSLWQTLKSDEGIHGTFIPSGMVRRIIILSPTLGDA